MKEKTMIHLGAVWIAIAMVLLVTGNPGVIAEKTWEGAFFRFMGLLGPINAILLYANLRGFWVKRAIIGRTVRHPRILLWLLLLDASALLMFFQAAFASQITMTHMVAGLVVALFNLPLLVAYKDSLSLDIAGVDRRIEASGIES